MTTVRIVDTSGNIIDTVDLPDIPRAREEIYLPNISPRGVLKVLSVVWDPNTPGPYVVTEWMTQNDAAAVLVAINK